MYFVFLCMFLICLFLYYFIIDFFCDFQTSSCGFSGSGWTRRRTGSSTSSYTGLDHTTQNGAGELSKIWQCKLVITTANISQVLLKINFCRNNRIILASGHTRDYCFLTLAFELIKNNLVNPLGGLLRLVGMPIFSIPHSLALNLSSNMKGIRLGGCIAGVALSLISTLYAPGSVPMPLNWYTVLGILVFLFWYYNWPLQQMNFFINWSLVAVCSLNTGMTHASPTLKSMTWYLHLYSSAMSVSPIVSI